MTGVLLLRGLRLEQLLPGVGSQKTGEMDFSQAERITLFSVLNSS